MRIGVINNQVPFVTGGAERHAANLCMAFRERGFDATEISLPFKWYPSKTLVDHVLAAKLLDLSETDGTPVDLMVGLRFPAYLVRHPNKVFWILHQHRGAYDLWDSGISDMLHDPDGAAVRALIHEEDRQTLGAPGARVYANSRNVSGRLSRYLGLPSTPLYHPPPNAETLRQGAFGDYLFAPSRMNLTKRQALMLDALALSDSGTRIVFAGPPDNPAFFDELKDKARDLGVENRVTWLGAIDDATMIRTYAEARGVIFTPIDEDYGYITLEAMLSGKPVITATDSGGSLEFIRDGEAGLVVPPEPAALAGAFDRLMQDPALAERMGAAGLDRYAQMGIGWDTVVATLTGGAQTDAGALEPDAGDALRGPLRQPILTKPAEPQVDIDALKAKIAPAIPDELPFTSMEDLHAAYDFDTYRPAKPTTLDPYFGVHWQRYLATMTLVLEGRTDRVLDCGISTPLLFQALLSATRPETRIEGIWQAQGPFRQTIRARREGLRDFEITLKPGNVECEPLPCDESAYDLVLGMEILEHLAVDPLFFVTEAARVLRPGGRIILTTPNVASHRGVRKILDDEAPYSFGIFVPTNGAYGRHNREYAPREVARLCEAAGFTTERLQTADLYNDHIDPEVAALLAGRGPFEMRGETILYVGRLDAHRPPQVPEQLYHGDPRQLSGALRRLRHDADTGETRLQIENRSPVAWDDGDVIVFLEWYSERGALVHDGATLPLDKPLGPGEATEVAIALDPGSPDGSNGTVRVELYQKDIGRMEGAGRANTLRLPCSEAAFLRLAGALPSEMP